MTLKRWARLQSGDVLRRTHASRLFPLGAEYIVGLDALGRVYAIWPVVVGYNPLIDGPITDVEHWEYVPGKRLSH